MRNLLLTLRIALLLLWGLGTAQIALGQSSFYHQGIEYRVTGSNTVAVASYNYIGQMTDLVVPSEIQKSVTATSSSDAYVVVMSVTAVDSCAFQGCSMLRSISLPSSVTSIGNRAFSGCTNLKSATLQNGLESIGNSAFYGCTSLTSVTLPNSVHSLGWDVFYGCNKLTDVTLSNSIKELKGTFQSCSSLSTIRIPASAVSLDGTFFGCSSLTSVVVPSSVSYIGDKTFKDCSSLVSVYLPNSVTVIGQLAFCNTSLTTVVLPSSLTEIQDNAFDQCSKLTKITTRAIDPPLMANRNCFAQDIYDAAVLTTPMIALNTYKTKDWWNLFKNVTGDAAFNNAYDFVANGIYYIIIDDSNAYVTYKDGGYNSYSGNVTIPSTVSNNGKTYHVTGIASNAFSNCSGLKSVSIPTSVTTISARAFYGCSAMSSLTIPVGVTSIAQDAFQGCSGVTQLVWNARECWSTGGLPTQNITAVTIGNEVQALPVGFVADSKITNLSIPSSVTAIGSKAFNGCASLSSLTIPLAVTSIGSKAFEGCTGVTSLTWNARECYLNGDMPTSQLQKVTIGSNVKVLPAGFAANSSISSLSLPATLLSIGGEAFRNCVNLANVNLPSSLESIGQYAFAGCSGLKNIVLPSAMSMIAEGCFQECLSLTEISIPAAVTSIGENAFAESGLRTVYFNAENCSVFGRKSPFSDSPIERIEIGESVTIIPNYFAYYLTGLTEITIPATVTSIGICAFGGCTHLKTVYYNAKNCSVCYTTTFLNCPIERIKIGENVTTIPQEFAFNLTGLTEITIPEAVVSIGGRAFQGCSALSSVTSWPLTPPSLGLDAFYRVPSSMCVYVPAISVDDYKADWRWGKYEILPMGSKLAKLSVALPGNVTVQDYANMRLAISETGGESASLHYMVTDKTSYTFGVGNNTNWDVSLTNQYGDVFGKIENVQVGEADANVTFSSLLQPQNVALIVKKPNGQDVTAQCKITWLDENGELLLQGNPIKKLAPGRKLKYQVTLPQDLATACSLPATNTYTVKPVGSNNIVCQLAAISQTHLSGKVKDAANNQPLYGATISAVQSFGGITTQTLTTQTDNLGQYSLDVASVPTALTVAAPGYINQTMDCDMTGRNAVAVPDVALSPITGAVINVKLTYTPAHLQSEPAETQNWYSDYSNVDFEVYNKTTGHTMTGVHVQYPEIVLTEDVSDGDVLELTATSRTDAFKPVKTTVTIAEQRATATINILEKGKVAAKFNKNINPQVVGTLYDAEDRMVKSGDYAGESLTMDDLTDGNYKLVTMGKSDFFNSIYDLGQFASAGLQAGEDYAENAVTIADGLITPVTISEVPFFDETKFYYTGDKTSFSVNKPDIVVGNYLTFRAQVDFKEQYASQVNDIQLIVDLPESCHFYENSVMLGGFKGAYTIDGNRIIIPMASHDDLVRFCAIPTETGNFNPSAFVQFRLNGKTITQPIGNANYKAKGLSIQVPSNTSSNTVLIFGTAFGGSRIEIYDNGIMVGQTVALSNGNWSHNYEIPDTSLNCTYHKIYAIVYKDDLPLLTETKVLAYQSSYLFVKSVDMIFGPYNYTFNFENPAATQYSYTYPKCGSDFTFIVNFSVNDPDAVSNVRVNVLLMDNSIETLDAVYDSSKCRWIAYGKFPSSTRLPINLNVEFEGLLMTTFDDTNRREYENQNIQNSMQEIEDFVDSNIDVELIDDYEDHVSFMVNSPLTETQWVVSARAIDRNNVNLDDGFVFIPEESYYYKDNYSDDGHFTATIVDNDSAFAVEFYRRSSIGSNSPSCAPQWWNSAVNFVDVVSDFFIPYKSYVKGVIVYNFWVKERYPWYINAISQENEWTYDALDAKCKDGSYRITTEQRKYFFDKIQNYQKLENDFYNSVDALANLWSQRLRNAFYYEALTSCVGKAVKAIPHAQFFKSNGKGGGLMRYVVKGGLEKRNQAEDLIENVFDHFVQGIELVGDWTEFMDYESVSEAFQSYLNEGYDNFHYLYSSLRLEIRASYKKCDKKDDPKDDFPHPPLKPYIDPSGFVYEGVPSNRLQGVTATCYYKETVEDMYGDEHEEVVLWDAEQYGQQNPLLTDENGYYRWDVPIGMWQVKYEKEGYETTYSDWLPVPPPQLDVNIGMVQMRQPEVIKARAYTKAVEFEFDKFMFPETLTAQNIKVTDDYGYEVSGSIELLDAEVDDPMAITSIRRAPGTGLTFASKVRFNADYPFYSDEVVLRVNHRVKSYADLEMSEDYEVRLPVEYEMEKIEVDSTLTMLYGDSRQLTVAVVPSYASRGKTLTVRSVAPMIATTNAETYTLDNNGRAVVTVHGDLPGMTSLLYGIDGYDLTANTLVNVMMENQMTVSMPTASIASGSAVEKGAAVYLRCATEGATIYYTLDGSCPCDPSPARKVYDGTPIIINGTVTIKAMATAPDLYDSEVATFVYRISGGIKGDVNGDGEVNIADVNAGLDIILGSVADEQTMDRADVNSDGEVNIADINALIDLILSPANRVRLNVNSPDSMHLNDLAMAPGDVRTVNVMIDNASRYSGMQCDITLPEGLTLVDVGTIGGNKGKSGVICDSVTRTVTYSTKKREFANHSPILTLTVKANNDFTTGGRMSLTNIVMSDNGNRAWRIADCAAMISNATGVNDLKAGKDRVWVEGKTLCISTPQDGTARLVMVSGVTCDLALKAGVTRHEVEPGIYVVVLNGNSHKVIVK